MSWEDRERKLAKRGRHQVHGRRLLELIGNSQENKAKKKRGKNEVSQLVNHGDEGRRED